MDELVVTALTEIGKTTIVLGVSALILVLIWSVTQSRSDKE